MFCFASLILGASGCGSACPPATSPKAIKSATSDVSTAPHTAARAKVPPTEAERREAADLRARAQGNVDAGRWPEALPDLERAFSLSADVTILGDLGLALDAVGRFDESWFALYRFRAEASATYTPLREKIDAKLGELEKQLGGLMIDADTPGAELIVREQVLEKLHLSTPIFLHLGTFP
jgi:hypothetical protein